MYLLWILGQMLEPAIGHVRFGVLYGVSLLAGSFGALLQAPTAATVGASGAVFGLMGAALVIMRARGFNPMASGIPFLIGINLIFGFAVSGIAWGGHIGGLIGGVVAAYAIVELAERRGSNVLALGACV